MPGSPPARLWIAGLGMFLLARAWGLGFWGRWFAGLVYPFCGFLVVWLLFPVTAVAIWMPWLFLATDRVFRAPRPRTAGWLAIVVALVVFGGHIQTSAHVLLAGGLYALADGSGDAVGRCAASGGSSAGGWDLAWAWHWRPCRSCRWGSIWRRARSGATARRERPPWWVIDRPRLLDAVCTAVPYVYGSQRRGHPNLARALGVHNLNESAGGYAGLATLIWLAPLAVVDARPRRLASRSSPGWSSFGAMGAFRWPPVDNLLRGPAGARRHR